MGYDKYPNYVLTKDFKKFKNISELAPHKHYTWYNARLLKYKVNNRDAEGIIYTPSDFDSTKKYPVIFNIYEKLSNYLNRFIYPALSDGRLNVPYFVNKGYVVFEPNINYNMGSPGGDALSSILAGFNYISQFKWVDTAKCGIQGISWGGYEINYTLTKTNIFKAASVSAGVSDLVSSYNSLRAGQGVSAQFHAESGQGRMGISLWQDHEKYIENSPILFADKVTTPVLIEHNRGDEAVPYTQGLEWFLALRRLNKKAWLVEYEKEGHGINNVANRYDFTQKLTQFFDYYLKGKKMPEWMEHEIAL
jgi:dipeptidyl aminopeptidase/acylaminoacyl peptidase